MATETVTLETILEGWGGKQGTKYPTWNIRWFVLEKKSTAPVDTFEIADTRTYFKNSSDSYERAHNYNVEKDKVHLVLTYYTDETKKEVKESFVFDENTYWVVKKSKLTCPKFRGGPIESIHLFCTGSKGSKKLVFAPFWGFVEPNYNLLCQPWVISFEKGYPNAFDGEHDTYYNDLRKVDEDTYGRTTKDLNAKLDQFKACFVNDITMRDLRSNPVFALSTFAPIVLGRNGQDSGLAEDASSINSAKERFLEWTMKFNKKMKELNAQKETAGSREAWLKLCAQASYRNLRFDEWMKIKDEDDNIANLPAHLR